MASKRWYVYALPTYELRLSTGGRTYAGPYTAEAALDAARRLFDSNRDVLWIEIRSREGGGAIGRVTRKTFHMVQ